MRHEKHPDFRVFKCAAKSRVLGFVRNEDRDVFVRGVLVSDCQTVGVGASHCEETEEGLVPLHVQWGLVWVQGGHQVLLVRAGVFEELEARPLPGVRVGYVVDPQVVFLEALTDVFLVDHEGLGAVVQEDLGGL